MLKRLQTLRSVVQLLYSFEDEDECHIVTGQNTVPLHMRGVDMRAHLHMRIEFTDAVLQGHLYHIRLGLTSHASWHLIHLTELCGGGDLQKFVASTGALDEIGRASCRERV
jgi:hypothetical protein